MGKGTMEMREAQIGGEWQGEERVGGWEWELGVRELAVPHDRGTVVSRFRAHALASQRQATRNPVRQRNRPPTAAPPTAAPKHPNSRTFHLQLGVGLHSPPS